ncbi:hypothetical protein [Diplocloster agilis]|uniref:hypothetical protein n=1 Tax=Diplocloster agilis TaxID=2850323 RepID=UPI00082059E5|nr:hypothetical protein [Suonthocola fibrivorans]MCU6736840.1 hypothetical protein [Suonthocola fibrivorans]SCJ93947.1 Uncharacterised protein [uncultured Clostridium sp.]
MRINNAFVEDVSCSNNSTGYIIVSYAVPEGNNTLSIQNIQLNINRNTTILNSFGQRMCSCCIQRGMWVNVAFSSRMTMSIPPQAAAFWVAVQRNPQFPLPPLRPIPPQRPMPPQRPLPPLRPQRPSSETTGRIVLIDFDNNYIITEDPNDRNNQTRFLITNSTSITNRFGAPIRLRNLQPGQMVRITHSNMQTLSIPPQTTAFHIQVI